MLTRQAGRYIVTLVAALALPLFAVANCGPAAQSVAKEATPTPVPTITPTPLPAALEGLQRQYARSDDGSSGAKVTVTWLTADYLKQDPAAGQGFDPQKQLIFRVVVDAPGSKISVWDLRGMLYLREDGGKEYGTPTWVPTAGSGTLSGVAAFSRTDARARPVPRDGARYIEFVIRDLQQVRERVFRWPLP
ncbi:MAG TPA: hypothetical protein VHS06_02595 [Chloroflexota bacterium]|nr:hypothetical protein [Chloroflexota bacterium]